MFIIFTSLHLRVDTAIQPSLKKVWSNYNPVKKSQTQKANRYVETVNLPHFKLVNFKAVISINYITNRTPNLPPMYYQRRGHTWNSPSDRGRVGCSTDRRRPGICALPPGRCGSGGSHSIHRAHASARSWHAPCSAC